MNTFFYYDTFIMVFCYIPTTSTCDRYAHHVVMDTFLNANYFRNRDLREWNPRTSDGEDVVVITYSGIRRS